MEGRKARRETECKRERDRKSTGQLRTVKLELVKKKKKKKLKRLESSFQKQKVPFICSDAYKFLQQNFHI